MFVANTLVTSGSLGDQSCGRMFCEVPYLGTNPVSVFRKHEKFRIVFNVCF